MKTKKVVGPGGWGLDEACQFIRETSALGSFESILIKLDETVIRVVEGEPISEELVEKTIRRIKKAISLMPSGAITKVHQDSRGDLSITLRVPEYLLKEKARVCAGTGVRICNSCAHATDYNRHDITYLCTKKKIRVVAWHKGCNEFDWHFGFGGEV